MLVVIVLIVLFLLSILLSMKFLKKTLYRGERTEEETMEMAGDNWDGYISEIKESQKWLLNEVLYEKVEIKSFDGLTLKGTIFEADNPQKTVICCHGYTSSGIANFAALSRYYINQNIRILIVDLRAHGDSEGRFIGFGTLDRKDLLGWIHFITEKYGADSDIILHGISMGAATVCMTSGLDLPSNVKGIISDCGFTSAYEVFKHVLKTRYHLPAFPILYIGNILCKIKAGYYLTECNSATEVKKSLVPILIIHGNNDDFVPVFMAKEIYDSAINKRIYIFDEAGHGESYFKEKIKYEKLLTDFIFNKI